MTPDRAPLSLPLRAAIGLSLFFLLLTALSAALLPGTLWGIHFLRFAQGRIVFFVLAAAAAFAVIFKMESLLPLYRRLVPSRPLRLMLFSLACGALFAWLRPMDAFLGDGNLLLNELKRGALLYPSNQADYLLHVRLYVHVLAPLGVEPAWSYGILSALAGTAFVFLVLSLRNASTPASLFLLTSGFMMVFFGYAESYAFHYLFMAGFLLFSLEMLGGRGRGWAAFVFLALAILFHQSGALLLPACGYLLFACRARLPAGKTAARLAIACVGAALAAGLLFYLNGFRPFQYLEVLRERGLRAGGGFFLPLWNGDYAAFSVPHLLDTLNLFLLSSPLALLGLPFVLDRRQGKDPVTVFLLIALASYAGFFFFMNPTIGMFRDWDLFSTQALVLSVLFMRGLAAQGVPRTAAALLVAINVFHTASWVSVNHGRDSSLKRFEMMADNTRDRCRPDAVSHNFEEIARRYRDGGKKDLERVYLLKALDVGENARLLNNLALNDMRTGDSASALVRLTRAVQLDPGLVSAWANLARLYALRGSLDSAGLYARKGVALDPSDPQINLVLGAALHRAGQLDSAALYYFRVLDRNPSQRDALYNLFLVIWAKGDLSGAETLYRQALARGMPRHADFEKALQKH